MFLPREILHIFSKDETAGFRAKVGNTILINNINNTITVITDSSYQLIISIIISIIISTKKSCYQIVFAVSCSLMKFAWHVVTSLNTVCML